MTDALVFFFRSLAEIFILTFVLRAILQYVRADIRNPLSQVILKVTDPLVVPVRRILPPLGNLDLATVLVAFLLQLALVFALVNIACLWDVNIPQLIALALLKLIKLLLNIYLFLIIASVILSWLSPGGHNPAIYLLHSITEPVLSPLRKVIPPIAGLDLTPLLAILLIQAISLSLPARQVAAGLVCTAIGSPI